MVEWSISKNRVTTAKKMWDEKRCENSVWVNLWQCWFRLCVTSHLYWLFQFRGICPSWAFNRKFCHWILHGTKQLSALSKLRLRFYLVMTSTRVTFVWESPGKQITICSTWEYWLNSCTFISWEKPRELAHFIFLLSLKLHDSKLMLKLIIFVCQFLYWRAVIQM